MCNRLRRSVWLMAVLAGLAASPALAQTDTTVTFTYPTLPGPSQPDNDGYLVPTAHTFQEGGMHVEGFWVKNTTPLFSPLGHMHIFFGTPFERSHGYATVPGPEPDRQGLFVRREDGGPFDLQSLDYRIVQPTATSLLIGTDYDPAFAITAQLTSYPVSTNVSFQTLAPTGFEGVTQLFIAWDNPRNSISASCYG